MKWKQLTAGLFTLLVAAVFSDPAQAQVVVNRSTVVSEATSTTDGNIVVFSGTGGKRVKDGGSISSIGGVPSSRTVSTTSPLGGGGALSADLTLTCTTCTTATSTFGTDNVIVRSDGTSRGTQSSGVTIDDNNRLELPVNASGGLRYYNVAGANGEYISLAWSGNVASLNADEDASGTDRALRLTTVSGTSGLEMSTTVGRVNVLGVTGGYASYETSSAATGLQFRQSVTSATSTASYNFQPQDGSTSMNASSGTQTFMQLSPTVNQTGTAGYKALRVNVTENTTGSGQKDLVSIEVGGTAQARVNNAGTPFFATTTAPPANGSAVACLYVSSSNVGFCTGAGAPTFTAAKGSIYTNTTATTTTTRLYVNTDGAGTWTNFTSAL